MEIAEHRVGEVVVVAVSGRVADGTAEANEFHEHVIRLVTSPKTRGRSVVFDFSTLEYISSIGERALVLAWKEAKAAGARLAIAAPSRRVQEGIETNRIHTLIRIYPSVDEAVAALASDNNLAPRRGTDKP